jgi:hypothetical protein
MSFRDLLSFADSAYDRFVAFPRSIFGVQAAYFASACLPNRRIDHGVV